MHQILMSRTGGPEVLEWLESADPIAGDGEVVIRTHASAVGWPEVMVRTGIYKWMRPLPLIPGNELTGYVESVGSGVTNLKVGQAVYLAVREMDYKCGTYAEKVVAPARAVIPLTQADDLDAFAGLGYFVLAWALLHEMAHRHPVERVLIIGAAGGIGSALVQTARYEGMKMIIGTVSGAEKAAFARKLGADHLVNYRAENVFDRVREITDGEGVDLILDPIVGAQFPENFRILRRWGTVVSYNATAGMPGADLFPTMRSKADHTVGLRCFSMHVYEGDPEGRRRIREPAIAMLRAGVKPHIDRSFPMSQAAGAHRSLEGRQNMGRILLKP
jgi:NADPH:quinone reductase